MLSNFFIDRPIFASVIAIIMILVGAISITQLPTAHFPSVLPPQVQVQASFPGASSEVVAESVTLPLEEQINGVEGMIYMSSISDNEGQSTITVTFAVGYDVDTGQVDVLNQIQAALPRLPDIVQRAGVVVVKQTPAILLAVNLVSPDGTFDQAFLNNYAQIHIVDPLNRIPGTGNVELFGGSVYAMRIWLDPEKLANLGVTAGDIAAAIADQNVQVAAGKIGQAPAPDGQMFEFQLNALGRLETVEEFENIIVRTSENGSIVRIGDIGRAELGLESYGSTAKTSHRPTANIGIFMLPGANALALADAIRERMERLSDRFPQGMAYEIVYDTTPFVKESISNVIDTLRDAILLVVLIVFIFLQTWRAAVIPVIAIPVSLVATFAVMYVSSFSINVVTMLGMVLAVGLVVDDAIVVVENVERRLRMGAPSVRDAVKAAMADVTGPIVATTSVLMAVFIPVTFLPGISGELYSQFALTIAIAVAFSGFNSLTLSPALCAVLLRTHDSESKFWLFRKFNGAFDRGREGYRNGVDRLVRMRYLLLVMFAGALGAIYWLTTTVPTSFLPDEDQGFFISVVALPAGSSLQRSEEIATQVETALLKIPGVKATVAVTGLNIINFATQSNMAAIFGVLEPWSERTAPDVQLPAILAAARKNTAPIDGALVVIAQPPPIFGLGTIGGFALELQDLFDAGPEALEREAQKLIAAAVKRPEIAGVFTDYATDTPQYHVDLDREKAKLLGVDVNDVFETLQIFLGSYYVNDFNRFGRVYQVILQAEKDARATTDDVLRPKVRNKDGGMIPLGTLITLRPTDGPFTVTHYNLYPSAKLNGTPAPGVSSAEAIAAMKEVAAATLGEGFGYEWTDTTYQQEASGNLAPIVFAVSVLFVYLLLAALYESWAMPLIVILAVPTAVLGAYLALWVAGKPVDIYAQIGLTILIGLAAKNAILMVEFAKRRRDDGETIVNAIRDAARDRVRPILMTAFALIVGTIPLFLRGGAGELSRASIGITVFGGMCGATLLTLILVPVFYYVIESMRERSTRVTSKSAG